MQQSYQQPAQSINNTNQPPVQQMQPEEKKVKGKSMLLVANIIFLVIFLFGVMPSRVHFLLFGRSLEFLQFLIMIAILPAIVVSVFGILDALKMKKRGQSGREGILISSILVLVLYVPYMLIVGVFFVMLARLFVEF